MERLKGSRRRAGEVTIVEREQVELKIDGPDGEIDAHAVVDGLQALLKLLESLHVMSGEADADKTFDVAGLSIGSARVSLVGAKERVETALAGIRELSENAHIPDGWEPASIQALLDLGRVRRRRGVTGVLLEKSQDAIVLIDDTIIENADQSIQTRPPSLGSVKGNLFRYNDDARQAGLRDERTGLIVPIHFNAQIAGEIRKALTSDVLIWGVVRRNPVGRVESVRAQGIELLEQPSGGSTEEVVGTFGEGWTNGQGSVDWVRGQRGE